MSGARPTRVSGRFFTPGTLMLFAIAGIGAAFALARLLTSLGAVTNLSDSYPWGLWIAVDVACGVALAAGGFTTAAIVEIFGRRRFRPLLRPAILTAWLGYAFVGVALVVDLGRYWNGWRPLFFWQGNSVLFEVGLCVMTYLTVLTVEMLPPLLEGLERQAQAGGRLALRLGRLVPAAIKLRRALRLVMPFFIIAGVVLSSMHQSALGTLMLIAPTKLSPLWFTPILPLLFLASAIMIGFPMVILESILVHKALGHPPETELLGALARYVPWTIGAYALLKLGDLAWRFPAWRDAEPGMLVAFLVELSIGVALPFVLFATKRVRRSADWLLFASLLAVFGLVLNRINVFLVGYEPPFAEGGYFPSVGEIAVTLGMVATIALAYRAVIFFAPILVLAHPSRREALDAAPLGTEDALDPRWAWLVRAFAGVFLFGFVAFYAFVHGEAVAGTIRATAWAERITPVEQLVPSFESEGHVGRPAGYRRAYQLEHPVVNERFDVFGPVRFTHLSHDELTGGDCSVCHHRFSWDEADRVGYDVESFHADLGLRLGGPCASCHEMESITINGCDACHARPDAAEMPSRVGLKGAYHRQCLGCHETHHEPVRAPTGCKGCHHPRVPDHGELVALGAYAEPEEITRECLTCHPESGEEILASAHWRWAGHSPHVAGHETSDDLGLATLASNHTLGATPNVEGCASCHVSLGGLEAAGPPTNVARIDCLVCHDTTGEYRKATLGGGAPAPDLPLVAMAQNVGRPSRAACGRCHFAADGSPNVKHGDLEPALADPSDELDVHMGAHKMLCQDCHLADEHRISGASASAPAVEGRVLCTDCHGDTPHGITGLASHHLDRHVRSVACETCHIPEIAIEAPTRVYIDWERVDPARAESWSEQGFPRFAAEAEIETWVTRLVPDYLWSDGTREVHLAEARVEGEPLALNQPLGERRDPRALIRPFKRHRARQPWDTEREVLVVPRLFHGLFEHGDMERAIEEGLADAGMEGSGSYGYVETLLYTGIHHEVRSSARSLRCADCHEPEAVTCAGCHADVGAEQTRRLLGPLDPERVPRLDFEALGYEGDPARVGGRFHILEHPSASTFAARSKGAP